MLLEWVLIIKDNLYIGEMKKKMSKLYEVFLLKDVRVFFNYKDNFIEVLII